MIILPDNIFKAQIVIINYTGFIMRTTCSFSFVVWGSMGTLSTYFNYEKEQMHTILCNLEPREWLEIIFNYRITDVVI